MKAFYKEFLRDEFPANSARGVQLGTFGKHPGWDDHLDDIGLVTPSLIAAKKMIYVEGIGGQIAAGRWEKIEGFSRIAFNHVFVWLRPPQMLVGRLWVSRDGKGRRHYPMVVCAHCTGLPLPVALANVLPCLDYIRTACLASTSAEEVRAVLAHFQAELVRWAGETVNSPLGAAARVAAPDLGFVTDKDRLARTLLAMRASAFTPARFNARAGEPGESLRLPVASGELPESLRFWRRFLATQMEPSVPLLLVAALENYWLDAFLGEPAPESFFALQASPRVLPLATEAPAQPPDDLRQQAATIFATLAASAGDEAEEMPAHWLSRIFQ